MHYTIVAILPAVVFGVIFPYPIVVITVAEYSIALEKVQTCIVFCSCCC